MISDILSMKGCNYKKNSFSLMVFVVIVLSLSFFSFKTLAADPTDPQPTIKDYLRNTGSKGGYQIDNVDEYSISILAGMITFGALTLMGTVFIVLTVYAGYLWMTARGKSDQVEKAREIIITAIIGMFIVFSAYAFTRIVYKAVTGFDTTANTAP